MWLLALFTALGLVGCLGMYWSLRSDVRIRAQHAEERFDGKPAALGQASLEPQEPAPTYVPLTSTMNFSRRAQALRLLRQGEDASHVAAALGVPRSEIELLIRVQELTSQRAQSKAARTG